MSKRERERARNNVEHARVSVCVYVVERKHFEWCVFTREKLFGKTMCACLFVCVCVCVRERERERKYKYLRVRPDTRIRSE